MGQMNHFNCANHSGNRGLTLMELMIVVAVISLISAIVIPKFGELILRSKESMAIGALGTFRSAIDLYYMDNEGKYPAVLDSIRMSKYIDFFPKIQIPPSKNGTNPGHQSNSLVQNYVNKTLIGSSNEGVRIWAYVDDLNISDGGYLGLNCIHENNKGTIWSNY